MFPILYFIPWLIALFWAIKGIRQYTIMDKKVYLLKIVPFLLLSFWGILLVTGVVK